MVKKTSFRFPKNHKLPENINNVREELSNINTVAPDASDATINENLITTLNFLSENAPALKSLLDKENKIVNLSVQQPVPQNVQSVPVMMPPLPLLPPPPAPVAPPIPGPAPGEISQEEKSHIENNKFIKIYYNLKHKNHLGIIVLLLHYLTNTCNVNPQKNWITSKAEFSPGDIISFLLSDNPKLFSNQKDLKNLLNNFISQNHDDITKYLALFHHFTKMHRKDPHSVPVNLFLSSKKNLRYTIIVEPKLSLNTKNNNEKVKVNRHVDDEKKILSKLQNILSALHSSMIKATLNYIFDFPNQYVKQDLEKCIEYNFISTVNSCYKQEEIRDYLKEIEVAGKSIWENQSLKKLKNATGDDNTEKNVSSIKEEEKDE